MSHTSTEYTIIGSMRDACKFKENALAPSSVRSLVHGQDLDVFLLLLESTIKQSAAYAIECLPYGSDNTGSLFNEDTPIGLNLGSTDPMHLKHLSG